MGGISWLGNRNWSEITRDERYFCAHLYKKSKSIRMVSKALSELSMKRAI